jgi:asparagine synthase (glutamine-hydrolysing)
MMKIFGWIGPPDAGTLARDVDAFASSAAREADTDGAAAAGAVTARTSVTGPGWRLVGPSIAEEGHLTAIIRGAPIWLTSEPAIRDERDAGRAVLAAYRQLGQKFLDVLHGSFAVVVFDRRQQLALLAVDRMGIERLTYARRDNGLFFGTSAEAVARSPGGSTQLNRNALLSYLFFHMIPAPDTVFAGVRKVPRATVIVCSEQGVSESLYWQPKFAEPGGESFEPLKDALHSALRQGVVAAAPNAATGAFLSGGLDSSSVAGYLAKAGVTPAKTFSMGFGIDQYDELRFARLANQRFGCQPHEYQVQPDDITDLFPAIARAYDEPFGNSSALPTYCCARFARQNGMDHLLAGDGGDEIFAGNKRYSEQLIFEHYQRVPRLLRSGLLEPLLGAVPAALAVGPIRKGQSYIRQANIPLPDRLENWNFLPRLGFETILHPDFARSVDREGPFRHMRAVYAAAPAQSHVNRMMYYDWSFTLADNDLRKVGTMCELAGIRVSYPMLHPDVVDVSVRVPPDLKMAGRELRTFYKRAMADFLPAEIINKTKHGFGLPFGLWLQQSPRLAELINGNLQGLRARGIVNPDFIDRLRTLHGQEDASYYGVLIWTFAMLEQWFQEHGLAP